jgi:hypothetical protein
MSGSGFFRRTGVSALRRFPRWLFSVPASLFLGAEDALLLVLSSCATARRIVPQELQRKRIPATSSLMRRVLLQPWHLTLIGMKLSKVV